MADTVKMERDDGKTADVHPDEVENYRFGGFQAVAVVKPIARKKQAPKPDDEKGEVE